MSKEQIIDEAYVNFKKWYNEHSGKEDYTGYYVPTKEEFIRLIKTDSEFSERWGLKIEERELDMMERWAIADLTPNMEEFDFANYMCDKHNVPTKLITITYNNETIEVFH